MKHIIAFAGSNSKQSINKQLVRYASSLVEGAQVDVLDLNDYELPIYGIDHEKEIGIPDNAHKFLNKLKSSDGIMISLAEHNGAYSAAFKNIFDWMTRIESKTFYDKPVLLMATSPGGRGGQSVLAIAQDRFPRHDANIVEIFSLPFFEHNFSDGKIINEELDAELKHSIEQFQNSIINIEIQHEETGRKGKFFVMQAGEEEAVMTYVYADKNIIIDHTEVHDVFKGQGIGYQLVDAAVQFARENAIKIKPLCPFANAVFKKKGKEYADVLF